MVCRRTRYVKLIHLSGGRTADEFLDAIQTTMSDVPASARLTLTWDRGSEMAGHQQVAELFSEGVYFPHAGKPWQRGTSANTNGLLRQYFPKGHNLRRYTIEDLRAVEEQLNKRPRKTLQWRTPTQILAAQIAST